MRQDARHARQPQRTRARRADSGHAWTANDPLIERVADATGVAGDRLARWVAAGLVRLLPAAETGDGIELVLADAARIRTLCGSPPQDGAGGPVQLRRVLDAARAARTGALEPMRELTLLLSANGELLVRASDGRWIDPSRRLRLTSDEANALPIDVFAGPKPPTAHEWHERGIERELTGDWHAAIDCYGCALRVGGPDVQVAFDLAHALVEVGEVDRAAERYRQVIEIDPLRADAWFNLGALHADDGRIADAAEAFRRALDLDPADLPAHRALAEVLAMAGLYAEADEHYAMLIETHEIRLQQWVH